MFLRERQTQWVEKTVGGRHAYKRQVLGLPRLTQCDVVLLPIALLHFKDFGVM